MQLGFAVWPLMRFTDEKAKMGEFANRLWIKILGWTTAAIIIVLNVKLLFDTFMPGRSAAKPSTAFSACRRRVTRNVSTHSHSTGKSRNRRDHSRSHQAARALTGASLLLHARGRWLGGAQLSSNSNWPRARRCAKTALIWKRASGELRGEGFTVDLSSRWASRRDEIIKLAKERKVDLIAMSTHGHRFISDLLYGSTADKVRHLVDVPVLLLKARR